MTEREHDLIRILRTSIRALLVFIAVFKFGMAAIYQFAPSRGAVLHMITVTGVSASLYSLWALVAALVALAGAVWLSRLLRTRFGRAHPTLTMLALLIFAILPGVFYTYQTFDYTSTLPNANLMILWMDIQLYVLLGLMMIVFSLLLPTIEGAAIRPKERT